MATTWMKALHRGGGNSVAAALKHSTEYIGNPEKTDGGEWVEGYECDARTVQAEFLFSKTLYQQKTGRDQGRHDVIAYHIRMSFKPGEVTAVQVLELGKELGLRWTKGKYQFIVAAHTNTKNPHAHIIFNSVNLDCDRKFEDFKRSAIALRRVSDQICLEHGLSVIEKPSLSKGFSRTEYLGENKAPTVRDRLRALIDSSLSGCKSVEDFLAAVESAGAEVKRGKQLAFKLPGGKKFVRQDTLGEDYSEAALRDRILGRRVVAPKATVLTPAPCATLGAASRCPNLLIDIQAKIQQGYGPGFERFAKIHNLKEAAKTLLFLQEHEIEDYDSLTDAADAAAKLFNENSTQRQKSEARLGEIRELQKHIGIYSRTLEVYRQYRDSGWSKKFYAQNDTDIASHKAAKKYFDSLGLKKLPTMETLKKEYATLDAERKSLSRVYRAQRDEMTSLLMAKQNVDRLLGMVPPQKVHENDRDDR